MNEADSAAARVEPVPHINDMERLGATGQTAKIAGFIEANFGSVPQPNAGGKKRCSLDELTPTRKLLMQEEERRVVGAIVTAVEVCYRGKDSEGIGLLLRNEKVPEYMKVEIAWACEKLGWAAPLRAWIPKSNEVCAQGVRRNALANIDEAFVRHETPARVVPLHSCHRPPQARAEASGLRIAGRY